MASSPSPRLALACLLVAVTVLAADGGRLRIPPEVIVTGDPVRLRDVALLEGPAAEALADVVLGPAPRGAEVRVVDGSRVLETLRRAGLHPAVTYAIPATLRLRRATQEIPPAAVRDLVEAWLARTLGDGAGDARLTALDTHGPLIVPAGAWTATVSAPQGVDLRGRVRLELALAVDGAPVRTAWVTADIARFGQVVVATRDVARGEAIRPGDLALERRELSSVPRAALTDLAEAEGAVARQPLRAWMPVSREQLGAPVLVHRGAPVLLVAERGALRVSAAGEARHDAARGERVAVTNRASGKAVVGRVVDATTVAVGF